MDQFLSAEFYLERWRETEAWLAENALALSIATFGQLAVVIAAFVAARIISPRLRQFLSVHRWGRFDAQFARLERRRVDALLATFACLGRPTSCSECRRSIHERHSATVSLQLINRTKPHPAAAA